jgi:CxxC motif-containing protein (DUF1111 family)
VGRFGRKAAVAALFDFNADISCRDGVTTPLSPVEETINGKPVPPQTDPSPDPEISLDDVEKANAFVRLLAPPPPQVFTNTHHRDLARRGQKLFAELKCSVCLKLQARRTAGKYAAEARVEYEKIGTEWKVKQVGLLSLAKTE